MRALKIAAFLLVDLILVGVALWFLAPRDHWPAAATVAPVIPGDDVVPWLEQREAAFAGITPGVEKHIFWAREAGGRTDLVLVYLHGFSATRQEVSPLAETLAQELGANLFATRLTGHGLPGAALGEVAVADWAADLAEAMAVASRLGDRIVLIGTSTGGSIAALAAADPTLAPHIAGVILISPNFELNNPQAWLLDLPFARNWVPLVVGDTYEWTPQNEAHGRYWTTSYPTTALFPMRTVQRAAQSADLTAATMPALVFYAQGDQVVLPAATEAAMARWSGPVTMQVVTDADDPGQHVIAGAIVSPSATAGILAQARDWLRAL